MIAQVAASQTLVRDYVALTKPRIVVLLLVTALGGMFLAASGTPDALLVLLVLGCGSLAAGGANALNHALDRDIDERMSRTQDRPVAAGRIGVREAVVFGILLNGAAFVLLGALVNPLSAVLTLSATAIYIFVYTKGLKRTTPQNIVIGGAAGAIPPLVGWAAVDGGLGLPALYLFAIVFFWTPPHFWALALVLKEDYARAGVPMLPVVVGVAETKRSILLYSFLVLALTVMLGATGTVGLLYLGVSTVLGVVFVYLAWRMSRQEDIQGARPFFMFSVLYLALIFFGIVLDTLVRA